MYGDLDMIEGHLSASPIFYKKSDFSATGAYFLICRLDTGDVVKGEMTDPEWGGFYRFFGRWKTDSQNRRNFAFSRFERAVQDTPRGVQKFLTKSLSGIGAKRAADIYAAFGVDTLRTLRERPEALLEIKGVTPIIVESIRAFFRDNPSIDAAAYAALADMFMGFRVSDRIINSLLDSHGSSAPDVVRKNPYKLIHYFGLGWDTVDRIAIERAGYHPGGIERRVAALHEALRRISDQGHTYAERADVEYGFFDLVRFTLDDEAIDAAAATVCRWIDGDRERLALASIHAKEKFVAEAIRRKLGDRPAPLLVDDLPDSLTDEQRRAVAMMATEPISILTGSAGVGKTFTIANFIKSVMNADLTIRFAAPTGKAAKRGHELFSRIVTTDAITFSTIHKALEPEFSTAENELDPDYAKAKRGLLSFRFARNAANPIDAEVLILDEESMVSIALMYDFFQAVASHTRIILVGDPYQLQSIEAGAFLRDLLDSAAVPSIELTQVQRNCGAIVAACHSIKNGVAPTPCDTLDVKEGRNWLHLEIDEPDEIAAAISDIFDDIYNFDKFWDVQVISAQKEKLPFSCAAINRMLSRKLNPFPRDEHSDKQEYLPGDKIVHLKNEIVSKAIPLDADPCDDPDYALFASRRSRGSRRADLDEDGFAETALRDDPDAPDIFSFNDQSYHVLCTYLVNGDMGQVVDFVKFKKGAYVLVRYRNPDRLCLLPRDDANVAPAFAMTVHKCQGSGFPLVIAPVHHLFYWDQRAGTGLWSRELLYTIFSRAETILVTIGPRSAIDLAVGRPTLRFRRTLLAQFLHEGIASRHEDSETVAASPGTSLAIV